MSLEDQSGKIWLDGELVEWRDAKIHVLTHGLHYGTGVFEGVRAYSTARGAAIFRLSDHTRRLFDSAHICAMKIPFSRAQIESAQREVVRANNLETAYIRPLAFYGAHALGLSAQSNPVRVAIAAWSWDAYLGEENLEKGIRVKISSFARHHVNTSMCRGKVCGHYVNSVMAHQEAAAAGFDEALLLDVDGFVAEGAGENLFLVKNGVLFTPELGSVLDGITRDTTLCLARDLGIETREKRITRDELYCADEAFYTGTAAEIAPIRELDWRVIGAGKRGPVTEKLQRAYFDCVRGENPRHADWIFPVADDDGDAASVAGAGR